MLFPMLSAMYRVYATRGHIYNYRGLKIWIPAGVFHPAFFGSSKMLLEFILDKEIIGKRILELGAGSGLVSLSLARQGAKVTASDINRKALDGIIKSAEDNDLTLTVIESDLLEKLSVFYDHILVNPPFFPKDPKSAAEHAFYCGANYQYFQRLFSQLTTREQAENVWMILSQDCDLDIISDLASAEALDMIEVATSSRFLETFLIYHIRLKSTVG